ncbi:hypothetical protein K0H71_12490 [Bacillus sp. IITD106]|nr:hypothetical protein [Bacillus sp. IITD106]
MKPIFIEEVPKSVNVILNEVSLSLPSKILEKHNIFWEEQKNQNPTLRNGTVFTITDIKECPDELYMKVAKTDYKHYLYTINHLNCEYSCKVIYTCACVITKDNYIVVGKMNSHTSSPGRLQLTGGGLDESDLINLTFDLKRNICKEIQEEMGLDIHSPKIKSLSPKFVKRGGTYDFWAIMYELLVDYSVKEINNIFQTHNKNLIDKGVEPEFEKLIFIALNKKDIDSFIEAEQDSMVDYLRPILSKYCEICSWHGKNLDSKLQ